MFQVSVTTNISAGHHIPGHLGKCQNPHGHNYKITLAVEGDHLDGLGILIDFQILKVVLREVADDNLDHRILNQALPEGVSTTAESLARWIYEEAVEVLKEIDSPYSGVRISKVSVQETEGTLTEYWVDPLDLPKLSVEQNPQPPVEGMP